MPTAILGLSGSAIAGLPGLPAYVDRVQVDADSQNAVVALDNFAGHATASFYSLFSISGSAADNLGDAGGMGAEYTRDDRVITEVVAWAATSGSGGVTRLDVQVQQGSVVPANFSSIFSNNVFKPAVSSSLGNYGIAKSSTFVSGSNMVWPKGTLLKVNLDTAAGAPGVSGQKGLSCMVYWKPTGSYFA